MNYNYKKKLNYIYSILNNIYIFILNLITSKKNIYLKNFTILFFLILIYNETHDHYFNSYFNIFHYICWTIGNVESNSIVLIMLLLIFIKQIQWWTRSFAHNEKFKKTKIN